MNKEQRREALKKVKFDIFNEFVAKVDEVEAHPYDSVQKIINRISDEYRLSLAGACNAVSERIDNGDYDQDDKEEPQTYRIGDKFKHKKDGKMCLLVCTAADTVCFVSIESGNRWFSPKTVTDTYRVTRGELNSFFDCHSLKDFEYIPWEDK